MKVLLWSGLAFSLLTVIANAEPSADVMGGQIHGGGMPPGASYQDSSNPFIIQKNKPSNGNQGHKKAAHRTNQKTFKYR